MTNISRTRTAELLGSLKGRRIIVVGDLMLDRYMWGQVSRMSPEAPVPVVDVEDEAIHPGGAANVASNVSALGAVPLLIGLVGARSTPETAELVGLLDGMGLPSEGLVEDPTRRTTVKTRIIAHHQHVVRADRESREPASEQVAEALCARVEAALSGADGVILQDYNKGVFSGPVLERLIPLLRSSSIPFCVDPKFERFFDFRGATVFKPNLKESEAALGIPLHDAERVAGAARLLQQRLEARNVLITRGENGMVLLEEDGTFSTVGTQAKHVYDVSGAGDTVIATLTGMLAVGAGIREATALANHAAGVVVGEVGVVPITSEALIAAVESDEA